MSGFYSLSAALKSGKTLSFDQFKGKTVIIVNVASQCGKTKQYAQLEALYQKYQSKGLEIVGFPSNQFGAQEPGTDDEIATFCELYKVTFPLAKKSDVNGPDANPVYKYLKSEKHVEQCSWNFDKFLVDKEGKVVGYFDRTQPIEALEPEVLKVL
ncbi:glutathione peroxidase [Mrakia frigida]|uniref:glutathione peroxidase n=1 Tax=Mrakia frigida TaxID=29902 RepID=UPI003FCC1F57